MSSKEESETQPTKPHHIYSDISIPSVSVPITAHSDEVVHFRLKLTQNEITSASGAFAGFLAGLVVCPLDVAKTRFQAQGAYLRLKEAHNGAVSVSNFEHCKYTGAFQSVHMIWKEEGIKGLYRGIVPITLGYFPTWMIYFTCYEHFKRFYPRISNDENFTYFASAISSGAISTTATNPIWVVKTRLMLQMDNGKTIYDRFADNPESKETIIGKLPLSSSSSSSSLSSSLTTSSNSIASSTVLSSNKTAKALPKNSADQWYRGTFDAFRKMYKNEGIGSFYKGLLPSYFGLVHVAIQFPLYENFKKIFSVEEDITETNDSAVFIKYILASSLSKMIASSITYPHEIVRTRMQLVSSNLSEIKESQIKGLVRVLKSIWFTEGFFGFYSGFVINLARTVPASAVTLVSFEYFKKYLQKYAD